MKIPSSQSRKHRYDKKADKEGRSHAPTLDCPSKKESVNPKPRGWKCILKLCYNALTHSMSGYSYVGPAHLIGENSHRRHITCAHDLEQWFTEHRSECDAEGYVPATYIVDLQERLWIADRRSEHVACAHGQPVLAAGELFIEKDGKWFHIARISNQSTGFCPPVTTWESVKNLLDQMKVGHPDSFDPACEFRRCEGCGQRQIVKDADFSCSFCGQDLPPVWNIHNQ